MAAELAAAWKSQDACYIQNLVREFFSRKFIKIQRERKVIEIQGLTNTDVVHVQLFITPESRVCLGLHQADTRIIGTARHVYSISSFDARETGASYKRSLLRVIARAQKYPGLRSNPCVCVCINTTPGVFPFYAPFN